jgi:rhodanese-related sulfurtransferase
MPIRQLIPEEVHQLMGQGYRYLDVRTEEEFVTGHPAGAFNIPIAVPDPSTGRMAINPDFLRVVEAHFPRDAQLILGCQSGMRSQHAAELLAQAGYTTLVNMQGAPDALPACRQCAPEHAYARLRGAGA